MILALFV